MGEQVYPRGQIAFGSGDLIDVTTVKISTTDNSKQVHTIRQRGAGITQGTEESTLSFDAVIGEEGQEANWIQYVKTPTITQLRVKIPGETITIVGKFKTRDIELPLDDAIKLTMEFIGHVTD